MCPPAHFHAYDRCIGALCMVFFFVFVWSLTGTVINGGCRHQGVRAVQTVQCGSRVAWFCLECEAAFFFLFVFPLAPRYRFIPRAFRYNEKKQIFSSFLSILTQTFKTHGKCTSSSTDSTDSSCNNIKPTLCAWIASVSDSSEWLLNLPETPQVFS